MKGFDDHLDNYGNPYPGGIWDGPGDNYMPGDDEDADYVLCTLCHEPVYFNGSSAETTIVMHSDYPEDGHEPVLPQ